jgi:hypothetical protein
MRILGVIRLIPIAATLCLIGITPGGGRAQSAEAPILEGEVKQRLVLDDRLLKSFPAVTIDVTFETGEGKKSGRYTGALLWSVIERAGLVDDAGKNARLKHTLVVTGRDGYGVALALGELDPNYEGKSVILAYDGGEPPASSTALRLVIPGDVHGGRSVRDVATIDIR